MGFPIRELSFEQKEQQEQEQQQQKEKVAKKSSFSMGFRSYIRQFLVAILMLFRPSGPCCLSVAEAPFLSLEIRRWLLFLFLNSSEQAAAAAGGKSS